MLTIHEVPEELERDYSVYKGLAEEIYRTIDALGQIEALRPNVNLFEQAKCKFVYIREGILKLTLSDKVLRLYSAKDFVLPGNHADVLRLSSEFISDIALFEMASVLDTLQSNNALLAKWVALQDLENKINLRLLSTFIEEQPHPTLDLKPFKDGEAIILEGSEPTEIYENLQRDVIGQQEVLRFVAVAIFKHLQGERFGNLMMIGNSLIIATSALVGYHLAENKSLSTLPVALQFLSTMLVTMPASLYMKRYGRRYGFLLGAGLGFLGAVIAVFAIWKVSFFYCS